MFEKEVAKETGSNGGSAITQPFANHDKIPTRCEWLLVIFFGAIVGTLCIYLVVFLASMWITPPLDQLLSFVQGIIPTVPSRNKLTPQEKELIERLLWRGDLISMDTIISSLVNYYNTIITILLSLVAAACTLSFMYVKSVSVSHSENVAEQTAEKAVSHFFGSHQFFEKLETEIKKIRTDMEGYIDNFVDEQNLETRIQAIENRLASHDRTEEAGANDLIVENTSRKGGV